MKVFFLFTVLILFSLPGFSQDWKLTWSDEFDYEGLPELSNWDQEEGKIRNNESQYYTKGRKENARVEDGMLAIEAKFENFKEVSYTSASVIT
ncbi:MAG: glycoside hydrolase family 16 protein, partial [Cyclobacteriaceae bacterium]|nr:glycoside hydrolase family 16 protein [Cyclobacteriaceae bacterium]